MQYNNQSRITDKKTLLRTLTIIFFALIAGQVLFGLVVVFVANKGRMSFTIPAVSDVFVLIVPLMAVACIIVGTIVYTALIKRVKKLDTLSGKLQLYLSANLVRCALAQAPSLFGIVASLLTFNLFYLGISALMVMYMLSFRPTSERIDTALDLGFQDKMTFDSKNDFR